MQMTLEDIKIGIVGLGYVGLPLASEFGKKYPTIGFDINKNRIQDLKNLNDYTNELTKKELLAADHLEFTSDHLDLSDCNIYIITVPTPIDTTNKPDIQALKNASRMIGDLLDINDIVVYESTVYPGLTEEECVPILESQSKLKANVDFFYGYSPERINPGDKTHKLTDIKKITSGSNPDSAKKINQLYSSIITAGTHQASSVMVAEAAKVIENIQRDVNIALINELSIIFDKIGIDTEEVLKAAGTKWNFHQYKPGLVGGHCIGVDPHYLTYKARKIGIDSKMITAGRERNENMSQHVADKAIRLMNQKSISIIGANVLILGFAFKENCPDYRNTKIKDLYDNLIRYKCNVEIFDPWVSNDQVKAEHNIDLEDSLKEKYYDAVILAVAHNQFKELSIEVIHEYCKEINVIFDLKHIFNSEDVDGRL